MHIAVILPSPSFDGGIVRSTLNMLRMLALGARKNASPLTLSFGYPEEMNTSRWRIEDLEAEGILMRPFRMESAPAVALASYYKQVLKPLHKTKVESYCVFNDGISNFEEADLWLIISDNLLGVPPPHKPYGVIVYDFVSRYYPGIWPDHLWQAAETRALLVQNASFIMTTTQQTKRDVVSYIGYQSDSVHVFPIEFDPPIDLAQTSAATEPPLKQIVWPTILSQHENHEVVLAGLETFLRRNSGYQVIVLGFHTQQLDPRKPISIDHPYVHRLRDIVKKSPELTSKAKFPGYVDDQKFKTILKTSAVLLHTSRFDNGSYTVIEAAWLNTPAVSSRYAAMEELARQFELPLTFFDIDTKDDLVNKLEEAIRSGDELRKQLPDRASLSRHSYRDLASSYWQRFSEIATDVTGVVEQ